MSKCNHEWQLFRVPVAGSSTSGYYLCRKCLEHHPAEQHPVELPVERTDHIDPDGEAYNDFIREMSWR